MKPKALPDLGRVRELLSYCTDSGVFTWRIDRGGRAKKGEVAGSLRTDGYWELCIDCKAYPAGRIAWLYVTGQDPAGLTIDHIDGDRTNNAFANLRLASHASNCANRKRRVDNTSGAKGVYLTRGKWAASVTSGKRRVFLGVFEALEDAKAAYDAAALKLQGPYAMTNAMLQEAVK